MSKARQLADFQGDASALTTGTLPVDRVPYVGRRNLIINGAMQVAQRGTSFTPSGVTYCLDRFAHYAPSPPTNAVQQSTDAPDGFNYSLYLDSVDLRHAVELDEAGKAGVFSSGQTITLSFYAKTGTAGSTYSSSLNMRFTDGASFSTYSGAFAVISNTFTITDSWERHVLQFTVDQVPTSSHKAVAFSMGSGTNGLYITGVQLELGSVATPFEHRSYGEELALCQRYYYREDGNQSLTSGLRYAVTGQGIGEFIRFPVTMRASPTMTWLNKQVWNGGNPYFSVIHPHGVSVSYGTSTHSNTSAGIIAEAEL